VTSEAGVDRPRLLFKVVQARFSVQTWRVQSRFKLWARGLGLTLKDIASQLEEAKRTMAPAGCDRMRQPYGKRHGRRRHCGFSGCSVSWGLRRPQNRSACWPPPIWNSRWQRPPCSEPVTGFQTVPTPRNGAPQPPRRIRPPRPLKSMSATAFGCTPNSRIDQHTPIVCRSQNFRIGDLHGHASGSKSARRKMAPENPHHEE
jgi:hypothetical protein